MRRHTTIAFIGLAACLAGTSVGAAKSEFILGYVTLGRTVNTTNLQVRRPPVVSGTVTSQGATYSSVATRQETGYDKGTYSYSVAIKAGGSWNAGTGQAQETMVVTIAGFKRVPKSNGTWQYKSVSTCPKDPWRFPVDCKVVQVALTVPPGSDKDFLTPAVSYPLSAGGALSTTEMRHVRLVEVSSPKPGQTVSATADTSIQARVMDLPNLPAGTSVKISVRPRGSSDFPTAGTESQHQQRTVAASSGSSAAALFDLAKFDNKEWEASAELMFGTLNSVPTPWVRFRLGPSPFVRSIVNIEAEDLLKTGQVSSRGGGVTAQQMSGFGSGWSNNAQLFWGASQVGQVLSLALDVPFDATFAVELYMTRAPDFGNLDVVIDTGRTGFAFAGFSPKVLSSGPLQMGKFTLKAGRHTMTFRVTGRYKDSKGYAAGVDRIRMYPSP